MSSNPIDEGVEPVPPELAVFYAQHGETGAPSDQELQQTWRRIEVSAKTEAIERGAPRQWIPPEWLAVAAVIGVVVVAQLVVLAFRSTTDPAPGVERKAIPFDGGADAAERRSAADACSQNAMPLRKAKQFEEAVRVLEECIRQWPEQASPYRFLGSAEASISARDNSPEHRERARKAYERFLELAPPDDDAVPKVRAILGVANE